MKRICKILLALAACILLSAQALSAENGKTLKILAIGNSFSDDAVNHNLWNLLNDAGIDAVIGNLYIGGCTLERHYNNSVSGKCDYSYRKIVNGELRNIDEVSLEEGIRDEKWDYVTVQQSSGISGLYNTYEPYLKSLLEYVESTLGYRPIFLFHQTWAYSADASHWDFPKYDRDQMKMYGMIVSSVQQAIKDNPQIQTVIPSGTAIQNGRSSSLGDTFNRDGYHLELTYGRYTAACTWFEVLSGKDVRKNHYRPDTIDDKTAAICRKAAHDAVRHPWKVTPQK